MAETKVTSAELKPTMGILTASGDVTLQITHQDVPGATVTVTPATASTMTVWATFDMDGPTAGTAAIGLLSVDGVEQGSTCLFVPTGASGRACVHQVWLFNLTAASHTIKLRAYNNSGTSGVCRQTHTQFVYMLISQ